MAIRYKKYIIPLSADERKMLSKLARSVKASVRKITQARWAMQRLADELVVLQVTDSISDETVRRTLKKTS